MMKRLGKIKEFLGDAKTREDVKRKVAFDWLKCEYTGIGKKDHVCIFFLFFLFDFSLKSNISRLNSILNLLQTKSAQLIFLINMKVPINIQNILFWLKSKCPLMILLLTMSFHVVFSKNSTTKQMPPIIPLN